MCGIGGVLGSLEINNMKNIGDDMIKSLYHRGPDGNGKIIIENDNNKNLLLIHTRLSIIDLNQNANQPMNFKETKSWIAFNGEIYNYLELKDELIKFGYSFRNKSDTEVILAAYDKWGTRAFSRFIGMWSFALWDNKNKKLILSRDRVGIKPLHYNFSRGILVFASDPHIVAKHACSDSKLNKSAFSQYFSYRQVIDGGTFFENVSQVEPGTNLIYNNGSIKVEKYWDVPAIFERKTNSKNKLIQELDEILHSSVKYRMIADVPIGSFLSGGLDSSALVWEMSRITEKPIKTYSIGFKEKNFNEFEYAQIVASQCKTDHHEIVLNESEYNNSIKTLINIKGAPLAVPNEIALYNLTKLLYPDVKVILSGEGADEIFGGYGRIFRSAFDYERVKNTKSKISKEFKKNLNKQYNNIDWKNESEHFLSQYEYIPFRDQEDIFSNDFKKNLNKDYNKENTFKNLLDGLNESSLSEKYMWLFQKIHIRGLLGRLDTATMANSIEGRVPFLDHRLIEFMNGISMDYKLKWKRDSKENYNDITSNQISENYDTTKYLLRTLFKKRLPTEITKRKKIGFPVPLNNWLKGDLKDLAYDELLSSNSKTRDIFEKKQIQEFLNDKDQDTNKGLFVWMLVNCEIWMKNFNVSI